MKYLTMRMNGNIYFEKWECFYAFFHIVANMHLFPIIFEAVLPRKSYLSSLDYASFFGSDVMLTVFNNNFNFDPF